MASLRRFIFLDFRMKFKTSVYPDLLKIREKFLAFSDWTDSVARMIQSGVLGEEDRKALTALTRDASLRCRVTRRANGCFWTRGGAVRKSPMRFCSMTTRKLFEHRGIEGITSFEVGGAPAIRPPSKKTI
jgi:hypothetical protein